jgi:hypothetical protein
MNDMNQLTFKDAFESNSPTLELLLACARTQLDSVTIQRIKTLLEQEINFPDLIAAASQHRVRPLVFHNLAKYAPEALSYPSLKPLQQQWRKTSLHNMFLMKELLDIVAQLESHGIRVISFKGPVLADVYGDLSLRQISDLDFLVLESDFQKTVDFLLSQGYQLKVQVPWETHLISPNGSYSIDLHQDVVPKHLSGFRSSSVLWEYVELRSILGRKLYTFQPAMMLIILCLNGTKEGWYRLNRICDVAEMIRAYPNLDWKYVIELSNQLGSKRLILLGLLLANNLLEIELNPVIWQEIKLESKIQELVGEVKNNLIFLGEITEPKEVKRTFFYVSIQDHWQDKLRSIIGLLNHSGWLNITKNDRNFLPLPSQLSFLYIFLRPIRIFIKYFW